MFFFLAISFLIYDSSNIRFSFGMLKVNLTVMLSLELQTLVQIWYVSFTLQCALIVHNIFNLGKFNPICTWDQNHRMKQILVPFLHEIKVFVNCDLARLHCSFVRSFNLLNFSVSWGCSSIELNNGVPLMGLEQGLGVQKLWNWDGYYQIGPSNLNYVDFIITPESSCFKKTYFNVIACSIFVMLFVMVDASWYIHWASFADIDWTPR